MSTEERTLTQTDVDGFTSVCQYLWWVESRGPYLDVEDVADDGRLNTFADGLTGVVRSKVADLVGVEFEVEHPKGPSGWREE